MIKMRRINRIQHAKSDQIFFTLTYLVMFVLLVIVLYPMLYIVACSFSDRMAVLSGRVTIFPINFSLEGYKTVFRYPDILSGYGNTIFYTVAGTLLNVCMSMICAFPLAQKGWPLKKSIMMVFTFTMFFSGGMIPTYLLVSSLGMINTRWALLLPGAISVYNMIIARTFIQNSIPSELFEAAYIDGCDDFRSFLFIVLPLSQAIIAVLTLYYAVGHWNSYFNAFIYLSKRSLYPLQIILREILIENSVETEQIMDEQMAAQKAGMADLL